MVEAEVKEIIRLQVPGRPVLSGLLRILFLSKLFLSARISGGPLQ
jgi:hypothetical protein